MDQYLAFEIASSLTTQIACVVAVTFALRRWVDDSQGNCRLWTICFLVIIGMLFSGLSLPHRRLFDFPFQVNRSTMSTFLIWKSRLAVTLLSIWGVGVLLTLLMKTTQLLRLVSFLRNRCHAIDMNQLFADLDLACVDDPQLSVLISAEINGPFCWQLHRPVIVLPEQLMAHDKSTVRNVVLHELEHLQTQHPMQHFLQGVCSVLFWFHPAVRLAAKEAELTREFLCDEAVSNSIGSFSRYLQTLATVAEFSRNPSCTQVTRGTLGFGDSKSSLIRRSDRLVKLATASSKLTQWRAGRWRSSIASVGLVIAALLIHQVWLPTNVLASSRSQWSPWPSWTANALHQADIQVRDFEAFDERVQLHEWLCDEH
ncbi:M56 family metallopeptidase [Roseiconus sp. JC912]